MPEPKTEIQLALEQRERKFHRFPLDKFVGWDGKSIPAVDICRPCKQDEDDAVKAARQYVRQKCSDDPGALGDPDITADAKLLELIYRCTFTPLPEQPVPPLPPPGMESVVVPPQPQRKSIVRYPAFQADGPAWMRKNLSSDELAFLHNLVDAVRAKQSPLAREIDFEKVEAMARLCWAAKDTEIPEAVLADRSRAYLTQAFTLLAMRYAKAVGWDQPEGLQLTAEEASALSTEGGGPPNEGGGSVDVELGADATDP